MTPDDTIAAFFAEQAPPARDLAFQAVVAERIARRRAWMTVLALAPWTIAAAAILWAVGPVVLPLVEGLGEALAPTAAILVFTGLMVATLLTAGRRLERV